MTTLKPVSNKLTLLEILTGLYTKVSGKLFLKRLNTYHSTPPTINIDDIFTPLSDVIDKIAAAEKVNQESDVIQTSYQCSTQSTIDHSLMPTPTTANAPSSLSRYFKARNSLVIIHPYVSDKLKTCIIDNIHASIRLARQGDARTAKLRIGIAHNAISELSHYIPSEQFEAFTHEVQQTTIQAAQYDFHESGTQANS